MPTKVEWADETWNTISGCSKISSGCLNCYAERMSKRLAGRYGYPTAPHNFDVTLHPDKLNEPLRWKKPRRVFVCSMGDLFHEDVGVLVLLELWSVMARCPQHTFMILTKRPTKMHEFMDMEPMGRRLPNVWLGVTVESPDQLWRVEHLLQIPAAVHFVSVEPMLGPLNMGNLLIQAGVDWIICGAETGPGARPMDLDWARDLRDQCVSAAVPFFFKRDSDGNRELDGRMWEQRP